jgi:type IV secretory pathway VirB3-like protein
MQLLSYRKATFSLFKFDCRSSHLVDMETIIIYICLSIIVIKFVVLCFYLIYRFCCLKQQARSADEHVMHSWTSNQAGQPDKGYNSWPAAATSNTTSNWPAASTASTAPWPQQQPYIVGNDLPPAYATTITSSTSIKTYDS